MNTNMWEPYSLKLTSLVLNLTSKAPIPNILLYSLTVCDAHLGRAVRNTGVPDEQELANWRGHI